MLICLSTILNIWTWGVKISYDNMDFPLISIGSKGHVKLIPIKEQKLQQQQQQKHSV